MAARMSLRAGFRRTLFGLLTLSGIARRGYFIPYRYAGRVSANTPSPAYPAADALLARQAPQFCEVLAGLEPFAADLAAIGDQAPPAPRWAQTWFPRLDAAVAYGLVRRLAPARIVEVGSGHSTRFLHRAVQDGGLATRLIAIDPAPRAALTGLPVDLRRTTLQEADDAVFRELAAGDMLLVDSSHILMPGTDVDLLLSRFMPLLAEGVLVQFHDIFLPDGYPAAWEWRGYNEQQGLLPLLLDGGWEVIFSSHYVATRLGDALAGNPVAKLPLVEGAIESAIWLRKRGR